jgi:hypothetical protein
VAAQLREYNPFLCWTAAELPPPELPDCHRSFGGSPEEETWRRKGSTQGAELPDCRRGTPAGLFSSRRTPAGADGKLRRHFSSRRTPPELPDCRRSFEAFSSKSRFMDFGESRPKLLSPNYLPRILLNHGRDIPHYESLLVVEVPESLDAVFMIHNII